MGVSPHLLIQTAHEWRARLLGGCPPLPLWLGSCPIPLSPSLHAVRLGHMLLRRSPLVSGGAGAGVPLSVHAVRKVRTPLKGRPFPVILPLVLGEPSFLRPAMC